MKPGTNKNLKTMRTQKNIYLTLLITLFLGVGITLAQSNDSSHYSILADSSSFTVNGNSTLHHWSAKAGPVDGYFVLPDAIWSNSSSSDVSFSEGQVDVKSKSIDSGEGGMNKKIYGAIDVKKYPDIQYSLENAKVTSERDSSGIALLQLQTSGKLTIHGVTNEVTIPVKAAVSGSKIVFTGAKDLKMTDFKINPPTALFGTIKADDAITVLLHVVVTK
ncbi:MAG TPA: YceI family protein [Balneolales bacterium]|nr:YceI family protein [Balneolales bacterium]